MASLLGSLAEKIRGGSGRLEIAKMGFDIVHGCQLRCIGCPNSILKPKIYHISVDDFVTCMNNVDVDYVKAFRFFNFGEPLLHPDLPELVNRIREFPFELKHAEISTNGQYCDYDKMAEVFKGKQLSILAASCDGDGTREDYERIRTPAKWDKFIEFLTRIKELRDEFHPELKLINRSVCETEEGQARWRSVLEPLGWTPQFREWLDLPGAERTADREESTRNGSCVYMSDVERTCYVDADGTVVPCCLHPQAFTMGNLKETKLSEIIAGERRRKMQDMLKTNRKALPVCSKCDVFSD